MNIIYKITNNPVVNLALRVLIGSMFIIAAIGKIADPHQFANEIAHYRLIPEIMLNIMALLMPWIELIAGVLVLLNLKLRASSFLILALLIIFTSAVMIAMARGLNINCGCFANSKMTVGWPKVAENTGLILASLALFISTSPNPETITNQ